MCDNNFETKEVIFIPPLAACHRDLSYPYAHPIYVTKTCNIRYLIDYNYYDIVTVNNREEDPRDFMLQELVPCMPKPVKRMFSVLSP